MPVRACGAWPFAAMMRCKFQRHILRGAIGGAKYERSH